MGLAIAASPPAPGSAAADGHGPRSQAANGAAAAERGWFGAARRHWQEADPAAGRGDAGTAERLERLARVEHAVAGTAAAGDVTTGAAPPGTDHWAGAWREHWRSALGPGATDGGLSLGCGLALWNTGRAVHAVTLSGGRAPWPRDAQTGDEDLRGKDGRDTVIFPRGLAAAGRPAGAGTVAAAGPPAISGSRCHAVVGLSDGSQRLVCLDVSPAAQGRIDWTTTARSLGGAVARVRRGEGGARPAGSAVAAPLFFAGAPAADHELCAVVVGTDAAADRFLAVFRAADGRLAWIRRVSSGGGPADRAMHQQRPWFVEDRLVVALPDGVTAFDRQGAVAWTVAAPAGDRAAGLLAAVTHDRIALARQASAGGGDAAAVGLEAAAGAVVWRWEQAGEQVSQLVAAGDGVIVVTQAAAGGLRLRRLAGADGRVVATDSLGDAGTAAARLAGAVCLGEGTLFVPVVSRPEGRGAAAGDRDTTAIEVLDPRSLERRRGPVALATGALATVAAEQPAADPAEADPAAPRRVALAVGTGRIVWASGGAIGCLGPEPTAVTP